MALRLWGDPYMLKDNWGNNEAPLYKRHKDKQGYKNWLSGGGVRPQHWINMCHLLDISERKGLLYTNGEHVMTDDLMETTGPGQNWPKYELRKLIIASEFISTNYVPIGKFTGLNIFSRTLSHTEAVNISSRFLFW